MIWNLLDFTLIHDNMNIFPVFITITDFEVLKSRHLLTSWNILADFSNSFKKGSQKRDLNEKAKTRSIPLSDEDRKAYKITIRNNVPGTEIDALLERDLWTRQLEKLTVVGPILPLV